MRIVRGVAAGFVSALASLFFVLSFAVVAFGGRLAPHLDHAVIATFLSSLSAGLVTLLLSRQPGLAAQPQTLTAVAFAGMAAEAMGALPADATPAAVLATGATLMMVATLVAALAQLLAGAADGGALLRHLPYPVLGGFMSAAGAGILRAVWTLCDPVANPAPAAVALVLGAGLVVLARRGPPAAQPVVVLAAAAVLFAVLRARGIGPADPAAAGWVLPLALSPAHYAAPGPTLWSQAVFPDALGLAVRLAAWCGIVVLAALMLAAGIEANTKSDVSVSREVAVQGLGSLGSAALGGMPGSATPSVTALRWSMGATDRFSGIVGLLLMAAGGFAAMRWGLPLPIPVAAGLLISAGVGFLRDWLIAPRIAWTHGERAIVAGIAAIALLHGFLEAVLLGALAGALLFVVAYARASPVRLATTLSSLRSGVERPEAADRALAEAGCAVPVVLLSGYLFFASAHRLARRIEATIGATTRHVVLDFTAVPGVDAAAVATIERFARRLARRGVSLVLGGLAGPAALRLGAPRAGLASVARLLPSREAAIEHVEDALLREAGIAPPAAGAAAVFLRASCGEPAALRILAVAATIELADGAVLQRQGDAADGIFLLDAGRIVVRRGTARLRVILPGATFGEIGRFHDGRRTADLVAEGETRVLHLGEEALARLLAEHPADWGALMHAVHARLARRVIDRDGLAQAIFG
jgi:SulP family sulfate permease